ncbi:flagellin N-terminal helical domain-containing protein [Bacillus cereus]|uniref:flagellin N-terminal helical domain-containing protein n=1 Tax=Bacillus cereus TaxID=1396 RepID=UPI0010BE4858|nr:flagellin [Bacillus cereus]MEC3191870.1 flagellin [Bacillus cereus]TKI00626.1 flagellin [Bacillus cereus]
MRINTNINSMRTQEYMRQNQTKMSNAMDRLSSGKRINNASDDAAGLAIATRMRSREGGLNVAARNTEDGMSLIRTADSALNSVSNILLRMRDLANQSASETNTNKNQAAMQKEFDQLKEQIQYIADNTEFNDKKLLDGSNNTINIQTLDSHDKTKQITISLDSASLKNLDIKDLAIGSNTVNKNDLETLDNAMKRLKTPATDGAVQAQDVKDAKTAFDKVKSGYKAADVESMNNLFKDYETKLANPTADATADAAALKAAAEKINTEFAKLTAPSATAYDPSSAVDKIDKAIETIASSRATLGATLNRLDFNVTNLKSQENSMAASASQIEDADMAKEMSEMTKFKILNEAGISMLSQANQTPQMVSKLLQ